MHAPCESGTDYAHISRDTRTPASTSSLRLLPSRRSADSPSSWGWFCLKRCAHSTAFTTADLRAFCPKGHGFDRWTRSLQCGPAAC